MEKKQRGKFSGKIGYVMATAGSAVGLGNIWRFPYLAAQYGGGIFLLVYIILAVTLGFTLLLTETAIGRKTGQSAVAAFRTLNKRYSFLGWLGLIIPLIIFPYYCVIGGWVVKYLVAFVTGGAGAAAQDGYFTGFVGQAVDPLIWLLVFMGATFIVVLLGVEKGVEKTSKFAMPLLLALSVIIVIFVVTRPGALEGVKYYFLPDFSRFSPTTVWAAMGQLFYSLSLAMGILITYGSYMHKDIDMESSVTQVELFDTGIALLAGLMIVPAVFVFSGGAEDSLKAGPSLMFVTLPKVFHSMNLGVIIGAVFFLLVLFAALTSAISLMETLVSACQDQWHMTRRKACILVGAVSLVLALPSSLGFGALAGIQPLGMSILDFFDFISNKVLMPILAFLTCLFVSRCLGVRAIVDEVKLSSKFKKEKLYVVTVKYIAPICILVILVTSVLDTFGIMKM